MSGGETDAITVGAPYELACLHAGISYQTLRNWVKRGEGAKAGPFLEFFEAIKAAEGATAVRWLTVIERAAVTDREWQPAAWKLERRYPQFFAKRDASEAHEAMPPLPQDPMHAAEVADAVETVIRQARTGQLSLTQGERMVGLLEKLLAARKAGEWEERMAAIEELLRGKGGRSP